MKINVVTWSNTFLSRKQALNELEWLVLIQEFSCKIKTASKVTYCILLFCAN